MEAPLGGDLVEHHGGWSALGYGGEAGGGRNRECLDAKRAVHGAAVYFGSTTRSTAPVLIPVVTTCLRPEGQSTSTRSTLPASPSPT